MEPCLFPSFFTGRTHFFFCFLPGRSYLFGSYDLVTTFSPLKYPASQISPGQTLCFSTMVAAFFHSQTPPTFGNWFLFHGPREKGSPPTAFSTPSYFPGFRSLTFTLLFLPFLAFAARTPEMTPGGRRPRLRTHLFRVQCALEFDLVRFPFVFFLVPVLSGGSSPRAFFQGGSLCFVISPRRKHSFFPSGSSRFSPCAPRRPPSPQFPFFHSQRRCLH